MCHEAHLFDAKKCYLYSFYKQFSKPNYLGDSIKKGDIKMSPFLSKLYRFIYRSLFLPTAKYLTIVKFVSSVQLPPEQE